MTPSPCISAAFPQPPVPLAGLSRTHIPPITPHWLSMGRGR